MKHIKDYLHFYLGCYAMYRERKIVVCGLNINSNYIQNIVNEDTIKIDEIKPILRPLSDMTEDEREERYNLQAYEGSPLGFKWLLSKGFDIFNLIEEGLAIDKTKL